VRFNSKGKTDSVTSRGSSQCDLLTAADHDGRHLN